MQNIGADNAGDAFYRYKMPKLVAKVEGRGNGIKTNIVNNVDIARALDRPPTYTLKHFGCELGAQTNFDSKTGTSIVNGAHDAKKLSEVLEIFIKKYVQCYSCGNPETVVKIRKECIFLKCKACGHTSDVDMREKLTTFMIKNPPENKLSKSEAKVKKDEKDRMKAAEKEARRAVKAEEKKKKKEKDKRDKSERSSKGGSGSECEGDVSGDNDVGNDVDAHTGEGADDHGEDEEENDDGTNWKTDISADAMARRQRELTAAAAALIQATDAQNTSKGADGLEEAAPDVAALLAEDTEEESDVDESALTPAELLRRRIANRTAPLAFADEVLSLAIKGGAIARMKVFLAAVFGGDAGGRLESRLHAVDKYVLALSRDERQQASLLIALEHYVTTVEPSRLQEMPFVLKMLFEEGLVDESVILQWGSVPEVLVVSKKAGVAPEAATAVRKASQKVLEWLDESDDDGEEQ